MAVESPRETSEDRVESLIDDLIHEIFREPAAPPDTSTRGLAATSALLEAAFGAGRETRTSVLERVLLAEAAELAALISRRDDEGEQVIEHPLLLAALARRREDEDEPVIEHPLLLAMLARRRRGGSERIFEHPLFLAALMRRRGEEGDGVMEHPLLLAALAR